MDLHLYHSVGVSYGDDDVLGVARCDGDSSHVFCGFLGGERQLGLSYLTAI
jgi:hypothetical protein